VSSMVLVPWRVRRRIASFNARGGRLLLAYSANDQGRQHLNQMLGLDARAIRGTGVNELLYADGADHNFTSAADRAWFANHMVRFLTAPHEARAKPLTSSDGRADIGRVAFSG
ncbi:MAG: hypothetical protein JSS20_17160, partial [Proteobacteria bacterium]|nr:hypothetical protein [Pseudomonadota bacterium]